MVETLSREDARRIYDRIGSWLDSQSFYEDRAVRSLAENGSFDTAEAVFEFGCGTGRFAEILLREQLGETARYRAYDLSPTMVELARGRLEAFGDRVEVRVSSGQEPSSEPPESCDRFVVNYVLDLLSEEEIAAVLEQAWRMLRPGGLLCLASICPGQGMISRSFMGLWSFVHRRSPRVVAGCRPIDLGSYLAPKPWTLLYDQTFVPFGIASEVVIAERRASV